MPLTRRQLIAGSFAAGLGGCGRGRGGITLNIWSAPKGFEERGFQLLCERFEREHPGIRVHNLGGLLEDKLVRAIVAGAPPDLAYIYGTSDVGPLAVNGAIQPLDERFRAAGFREADFLPAAIAQERFRGRLYAMPMTRDCHAFFWNKSVFRQEGLDPDRPPRTLEELIQTAKRLTRRRPDGTFARFGFMPIVDDMAMMLCVFGARINDPHSGQLLLRSRQTVDALERLVQITDAEGGRDPIAAFHNTFLRTDTAQNPLGTGRVAMSIEGEWVPMHLEKYAPDCDYGVGEIPYPADRPDLRNLAWYDGDVLVIPTGAANPDTAWEFMRWMQAPRQQEEYAGTMNNLPSIRALLNSPKLTRGSRKREGLGIVLQRIAGVSTNAQFFPTLPVSRYFRDVLGTAIEAAMLHQKTPGQALSDAQTRVEAELSRYP